MADVDYNYSNTMFWGDHVDMQDNILSGTPLTGWLWANNNGDAMVSGNADITNDDVFIYPVNMNILDNLSDVQSIINYHNQFIVDKYNIKNDYYKGRHHGIITRHGTPIGKPDNRNTINLPKELVDSFNSFAFSNLANIVYNDPTNDDQDNAQSTPQEDAINKALQRWFKIADLEAFQSEIARTSSIYGRAYCYAYKYNDTINMSICTPMDTIVVYDNTVKRNPMFAIRYDNTAIGMSGTIITQDADYHFEQSNGVGSAGGLEITNYDTDQQGNFVQSVVEVDQHPEFGCLPVIELYDNPQRVGIFDDNINNIDTINSIISSKANDTNSYKNNILKVTGIKLDKKAIENLNEKQVINLYPTDQPLNGDNEHYDQPDAGFISPEPHDDMQENTLNRLIQKVYSTACVVNLDEQERSSRSSMNSGIAIKERYSKMMGKAREKSNYMSRMYRQLLTLFFNESGMNVDVYDIDFSYGYEEPQDIPGQAQALNFVFDKVPNHIAYQAAPGIITNPVAAAQEFEDEQAKLTAQAQQLTNSAVDLQLGDDSHADSDPTEAADTTTSQSGQRD